MGSEFYGLSKTFLEHKFADIGKRLKAAIGQLSDEQLNWRPGEEDNSIANLVVHLEGNARQRILSNLFGEPDTRDRDAEFDIGVALSKPELLESVDRTIGLLQEALEKLKPEEWLRGVDVRGKQTTVFEVLNQIGCHFSEHLGQVLFIAKTQLKDRYVTTSIPRAKR
ncbi:DinB family protein [Paenibacillus sp. GYB003]|uniref:DinB family protein n=1 Tax=Paenibacillus sp. GYB003 TaxID=2994392 RepID=UPI002F9650E8